MPRRPKTLHPQQPLSNTAPLPSPASRRRANKRDVAREYGVSVRTVDSWIAQKKIPYKKLGSRLIRFDLDEVERALSRYTVNEIR
jgi:excisionase family DNA binding protein